MKNRRKGRYIDKKEWLLRYTELMKEVEREAENADYWQEKARSLSTPNLNNFGIRSSNRLDNSDYIVKFIDLARHCSQLADEAEEKKEEILSAIKQLPNHDYREVLSLHYIDGKSFREIAQLLGYSLEWVWKLHSKALKVIEIS